MHVCKLHIPLLTIWVVSLSILIRLNTFPLARLEIVPWYTPLTECPNFPFTTDAVPKKRGPKTDVLEALLKRVDGLEQRLRDQKKGEPNTPTSENGHPIGDEWPAGSASTNATGVDGDNAAVDIARNLREHVGESADSSPNAMRFVTTCVKRRPLVKPYYILTWIQRILRDWCSIRSLAGHLLHQISRQALPHS